MEDDGIEFDEERGITLCIACKMELRAKDSTKGADDDYKMVIR